MNPSRAFTTVLMSAVLALSAKPAGADETHAQDDAFFAAAAALLPAFQGVPDPVDPAESQNAGGWDAALNLPHVPVTAANLPDGRVLTYASNQRTSFPNGAEFTYAAVWNPRLAQPAAIGMGVLMLGAFVMHLKVKDPFSKAVPSLVVLAMCVAIALL